MALDVLIQTYNEEANLPATLQSLEGWVDRIFVVDSGSTDDTVKIAEEAGASVHHQAWLGYAKQKNWALANLPLESPWTLIVDADEAVSPELRDEILAITDRPPEEVEASGFNINRVFIFLGRRIRHCGYFPSWNLRLFKKGEARYEDRLVHEHMLCDGPVQKLRHLLVHEDRRGLEHFFAKHNRYSTLEAEEIYLRPDPWPGLGTLLSDGPLRRRFAKSRVMPVLPVAWLFRFFYMYVARFGFLDGRAGWWLCCFIAQYEFAVQLKLRQLRRLKGRGVRSDVSLARAEGGVPAAGPTIAPVAAQPRSPALPRVAGEIGTAHAAQVAMADSRDREDMAPTLVERRGALFPDGRQADLAFVSPWSLRQNIGRALWMIASKVLFRTSFHNWYGWRRWLLRRFGATVGSQVRVRPTAHIEIPWNIELRDGAVIGDHAILYSLGKITVGRRAVVSQYAHLCAGTHDYRYRDFPLLRPPVVVGDDAWVAADSFVGPNVIIGDRSVIGARSSVFKDVPPDVVAVGNPAGAVKQRRIFGDERFATPPASEPEPDSADDAEQAPESEPEHSVAVAGAAT